MEYLSFYFYFPMWNGNIVWEDSGNAVCFKDIWMGKSGVATQKPSAGIERRKASWNESNLNLSTAIYVDISNTCPVWELLFPRASERASKQVFSHPMDFCLRSSAEGVRSASEHRAVKYRISQRPSLWYKSVERIRMSLRKDATDVIISD